MLIAYAVIQALDANVVPILFSETVNPHPVAIIVAVLVFAGSGVSGVFFSIPLTTLVGRRRPGRGLGSGERVSTPALKHPEGPDRGLKRTGLLAP